MSWLFALITNQFSINNKQDLFTVHSTPFKDLLRVLRQVVSSEGINGASLKVMEGATMVTILIPLFPTCITLISSFPSLVMLILPTSIITSFSTGIISHLTHLIVSLYYETFLKNFLSQHVSLRFSCSIMFIYFRFFTKANFIFADLQLIRSSFSKVFSFPSADCSLSK